MHERWPPLLKRRKRENVRNIFGGERAHNQSISSKRTKVKIGKK